MLVNAPENWLAEFKPWEPGLIRWKSGVTTLQSGRKPRRRRIQKGDFTN